jgi:hypothetical protein
MSTEQLSKLTPLAPDGAASDSSLMAGECSASRVASITRPRTRPIVNLVRPVPASAARGQGLLQQGRVLTREQDQTVAGFNLGINDGEAPGQTVLHRHVHLIPRRLADLRKSARRGEERHSQREDYSAS